MTLPSVMTLVRRVWSSPTLMSWGSIGVRLLGLLALLPLILRHFDAPDIVLWLLFGTIISLQMLADAGFSQTFARSIACAEGGATVSVLRDLRNAPPRRDGVGVNHETLRLLLGTMRTVYGRLVALSVIIMAIAAPLVLWRPVMASSQPAVAAGAAAVVLLTTAIILWGNFYSSYMQGRERIARLRRWDMLTAFMGIVTAAILLLLGGDILHVVVGQQVWALIFVIGNRRHCMQDETFRSGIKHGLDREVFLAIWPGAWRSGVGVLMSFGLIQFSGMAYAQTGASAEVASYLLALRIIQAISVFSQPPFYSKLPAMARLRSQGMVEHQIELARKGMMLSHWTYLLGFLVVGVASEGVLRLIESRADFVSHAMWSVLGLAFFFERLGAMHIQLFSTTNKIIWHVANGCTGLVIIVLCYFLHERLGLMTFPVSMLLAYASVYCVISLWHSYQAFNLRLSDFEWAVSIRPFIMVSLVWLAFLYFERSSGAWSMA